MKFQHHPGIARIGAIGVLAVALGMTAASSAFAVVVQLKQPDPTDMVIQRDGQSLRIDPSTGRLVQASADVARTFLQTVNAQYERNMSGVVTTVQTSGMKQALLPEDFMEVAVLRVLPDGSTRVDCVQASQLDPELRDPATSASTATPSAAPALVTPSKKPATPATKAVRAKSVRKATPAIRTTAGR